MSSCPQMVWILFNAIQYALQKYFAVTYKRTKVE